MNKPDKNSVPVPRRQFRLGSLMLFTAGLCVVWAVLAALDMHPLQVLFAVTFFSIGVAVLVAQFELIVVASGIRKRQRHDTKPRRI